MITFVFYPVFLPVLLTSSCWFVSLACGFLFVCLYIYPQSWFLLFFYDCFLSLCVLYERKCLAILCVRIVC